MPKVEKIEPHSYSSCDKKTRNLTGVVLVFHPQCGHCVQMRPAWEMMKKRVPPHVRIVEVNGSQMSESPVLSRSVIGQNTAGYPSILRLRNGHFVKSFTGERTPENFIKFVKESSHVKTENRKRRSITKKRRRTSKKN